MKFTSYISLLALFLLISLSSHTQTYNFTNYNVEQGLAQSQVRALCQDKYGNIWIGTLGGGVNKYDGYTFETYTVTEGLPDNMISDIVTDHDGNLWFATANGIAKYILPAVLSDPPATPDTLHKKGTFVSFTTQNGLLSNNVLSVLVDKQNNLWVYLTNGVSILPKDSTGFVNITQKEGLTDSISYGMCNDILDNFYVVTLKGINIIPPDYISFRLKNKPGSIPAFKILSQATGLPNDTVYEITSDKKGNVWIFHKKGISMLEVIASSRTGSFVLNNYPREGIISDIRLNKLFFDNENNLWLGSTSNGIDKLYFSDDKKAIIKRTNYSMNNGVPNNEINTFLADREGNLWIGTNGGGVVNFSGAAFEMYTVSDGLPHNIVFSIYEDKKGRYWFGTFGGGLSIYDPKDNMFSNFNRENKNFMSNVMGGTKEDKRGNVWVTNDAGVALIDPEIFSGKDTSCIKYNEDNGLPGRRVNTPFCDSKGNIWLGIRKGLMMLTYKTHAPRGKNLYDDFNVKLYTVKNGLVNPFIRCIREDHEGNIWIGSGEGVSVLPSDIPEDTSKMFINYTTTDGLPHNEVLAIQVASNGSIWLGTAMGISLFDTKEEKFINLGRQQGLSADLVYLIEEDNEGNLWVGTSKGLDKLTFDANNNLMIRHYGKLEGFMGIETNHTASLKDSKGNLWFGTVNGVVKYNAKEDRVNKVEPLTNITRIQLFLKDAELPSNAVYAYDQNYFTFHFSGISHTITAKVRYQFKLENFDKEWLPVTTERKATYSNISPGKYTFLVKSCNNDGVWNQTSSSYHFVITPPFWRTWWFYLICIVTAVSSIYGYMNWRNRELLKAKRILEEKVEERTRELRAEKEKVERINMELEKLSLVASETDNAVVISDAKGKIEWINAGFTRMHGYTLDELKKEKGENLKEVSANEQLSDLIKESIKKKQSMFYESIHRGKTGKEYWVSSTLTPIFDKEEKLRKIVIIDAEITDLKNFQAELERSNKELDDFASIVSHDLKEPLRKVLTYASRVNVSLGVEIKKEVSEFIDQIQNAAGRMQVLIEDVLKFSRVTTKKAPFEKVDLNIIVKEVISDLEVRIQDTGGKVMVDKLPVIDADRLQMRQVFQNLIANALKFHKKDVAPIIKVYSKRLDGGVWEISVEDNGVGFEEKYLDRIFKPFQRLHSKKEFEGSGMGTTICHKIVKRHGGNLTARSKVNEGSTFLFTLPEKQEEAI